MSGLMVGQNITANCWDYSQVHTAAYYVSTYWHAVWFGLRAMPLNITAAQELREADSSWLQSRQELPYWEIPSTLHQREEELVQLLPLALAGLVSTLLLSPGGVGLHHPQEQEQGPGTIILQM